MIRDNSIAVGIATNKEILRTRIVLRSEQLFLNNVVSEAMLLARKYGWDNEAMTGNVYPIIKKLIEKENPLFGRFDLVLKLKPMDYYDSAQFYPHFSDEDKVRLYSVFGGIPYYNRLIREDRSVKENIIELIVQIPLL